MLEPSSPGFWGLADRRPTGWWYPIKILKKGGRLMYRIEIKLTDNPAVINTADRKLARAVAQLANEHPKVLTATVTIEVQPRPVKFKGVG